jgi:hypothetical protein
LSSRASRSALCARPDAASATTVSTVAEQSDNRMGESTIVLPETLAVKLESSG